MLADLSELTGPYITDPTPLQAARDSLRSAEVVLVKLTEDAELLLSLRTAAKASRQAVRATLHPKKGVRLEEALLGTAKVSQDDLSRARTLQSRATRQWLAAKDRQTIAERSLKEARAALTGLEAADIVMRHDYAQASYEAVSASTGRAVLALADVAESGETVLWFWPADAVDLDAQLATAIGVECSRQGIRIIDCYQGVPTTVQSLDAAIAAVGDRMAALPTAQVVGDFDEMRRLEDAECDMSGLMTDERRLASPLTAMPDAYLTTLAAKPIQEQRETDIPYADQESADLLASTVDNSGFPVVLSNRTGASHCSMVDQVVGSEKTYSVTDVTPPGWPEQFIAADQTVLVTLLLDDVPTDVAQVAANQAACLVRNIDALATTLLDAARRLAASPIDERQTAVAAVDVFTQEYEAASVLPAGARRKALFAMRPDMIDLACWLNVTAHSYAMFCATNDNTAESYVLLVIVRQSGRLLFELSPDRQPPLRYISLFSGMEACSAALERIGADAEPVAFSEIDAAASAVLAHRWPNVINAGDVSAFNWEKYHGQVTLVAGGSPCQSYSVAGKRLGLDDPRGNLALHFLRVVDAVRPRWFLYENVPGLLNSRKGDDFKAFRDVCSQIGYSCAWRILDARHFGVPQRRRRLFVVGSAGSEWTAPAAVLFEPTGEGWDPLAGRTAWKTPARRAAGRLDVGVMGRTIQTSGVEVESKIYAADARHGVVSESIAQTLQSAVGGISLNKLPLAVYDQPDFGSMDVVPCMPGNRDGEIPPNLPHSSADDRPTGDSARLVPRDNTPGRRRTIRRLTPLECMRLQGYDDDWLDGVTLRGRPLADIHKHRLAANSWAIPCAAWILDRILGWDEVIGHGLPDECNDGR